VAPEVKFCGLTRVEDAELASELGAAYIGVIFAGGPRTVPAPLAAGILRAGHSVRARVGVFGAQTPAEIAAIATEVPLEVVQLHADPTPADVDALRRHWHGVIWAAVRIAGTDIPRGTADLFRAADAVVFDARVSGRLGGTGVPLAWARLRDGVDRLRARRPLVLAGGLTPENVAIAADALEPDVVDVSSGVERAPGIKDHARMRAFAMAVRRHGAER
jgi:phosphoribosylanthranilate isomerase